MTECEEIALAIWGRRSSLNGNGLNATLPIRTYADAEEVARLALPDEGATIRANVAEALFDLATIRGVAKH